MLTSTLQDDELVTAGEVQAGDVYPGFCCRGYDYEIVLIFPDDDIWGICSNPDCPRTTEEPDDYYRGVSYHLIEDFAERLAKPTIPAVDVAATG